MAALSGCCDLCVPVPTSPGGGGGGAVELREAAAKLLALGYDTMALEHRPAVPGRITEADRLTPSGAKAALAAATADAHALAAAGAEQAAQVQLRRWNGLRQAGQLLLPQQHADQPPATLPPLQVLMRLTFTAGELVETEALASAHAVTSGYDLLAVEPTSERVLQQACVSLDVDVVKLNACERLPFKLKPATLRPALVRGLVFEVCYAGALLDSAARVMFLSNVQALARCTRGRNILLSSGAGASDQLRGPHAASSLLACALDVPVAEAALAMTFAARAAVANGVARRARAVLGPAALRPTSLGSVAGGGGKKVQQRVGLRARAGVPGGVVALPVAVEAAPREVEMEDAQQQQQGKKRKAPAR